VPARDPLTLLLCLLRQAAPIDTEDTAEDWLVGHGMLRAKRLPNGGVGYEATPIGMAVAQRAADQLMHSRNIAAVMAKCRRDTHE